MKALNRVVVFILPLMMFLGATASPAQPSPSGVHSGRVAVVEDFMMLMVERQLVNPANKGKIAEIDQKMLALLAPYYFEAIGVDKSVVTINKYSPNGFRVISERGAYIGVKLLRKTAAWPTVIVFKTAEHRGGIYIEPASISLAGKDDPSLVTPWFYAAEQHDVEVEKLPLPEIGVAAVRAALPAAREVVAQDGTALVRTLIGYLARRDKLGAEERRALFRAEILPNLARVYTDIYGIDLSYYEDLTEDNIKDCKIAATRDSYVVTGCESCLYDNYSFRIVMEDGRAKIMPSGIDNYRKSLSPVWLRE